MERSQALDASRRRRASGTTQLKLYGMKAAYDEIITVVTEARFQRDSEASGRTAADRPLPGRRMRSMLPRGGDLLNAEISEKQARSIKYQMTIAKLPLAKEVSLVVRKANHCRQWTSSALKKRRSTRRWCAIWPLVSSSNSSAMSCSSVAPGPANPTLP